MDWTDATWMLTGLAAVVILLTRVRLGGEGRASGFADVSRGVLAVHTIAGLVALAAWCSGLVAGIEPLTWFGLAAWWVVTVCGLMLLARWLPSGGRHAEGKVTDSWGEGAGLSALAHLGMLGGVLFFTFVLVTGRV
jgi:hypothetical protein